MVASFACRKNTWQYDFELLPLIISIAQKKRNAFHDQCVCACSGSAELRGLKLPDAIDNGHADGERILLNACEHSLHRYLAAGPFPSPPPPIPQHVDIEVPRVVALDGVAQTYGFCLREVGLTPREGPEASVTVGVMIGMRWLFLARVGDVRDLESFAAVRAGALTCLAGLFGMRILFR